LAGTCSSGLALTANQSCSLLLTYQPKSAGNHNIAIKLYNNSPTPSQFLTAYGTGTAINQINVTEFYHAGLDHYFISADAPEISAIEQGAAGPGWVKTGQVFAASAVPASNLAPVCRFYGNPGLGPNSHFYTAQAEECALLKSQYQPTEKSWRYEQTAFYISVNTQAAACPGTAQIRRFYNRGFPAKDSNHRYVNSAALAANMLSRGWVDEGVVFCAQP
jgi:serine protease